MNSAYMDEIIAKLKRMNASEDDDLTNSQPGLRPESGNYDLLIEHLQSAQASLLGGMPREAAMDVELARGAHNRMAKGPLRDEVQGAIDYLSEELDRAPHSVKR